MKTYPLTQTQIGIFLAETAAQGNANYNIDMLYHLDADIDIEKLKTALEAVINNHPYVKSALSKPTVANYAWRNTVMMNLS